MARDFVGQQFLQNVLGYSTLDAGRRDPAGGPADGARGATVGQARRDRTAPGSPCSCGYVFCFLGFAAMLLLWKEGIPYWKVGLAYGFVGARRRLRRDPGLALATGSVPVRRAGMALGHRRPAARPRRRDHAVDPGRAPHRRIRGRDRARRSPRRPTRTRSPTGGAELHEVVRQRRAPSPQQSWRVSPTGHRGRRGPQVQRRRATERTPLHLPRGPTPRDHATGSRAGAPNEPPPAPAW